MADRAALAEVAQLLRDARDRLERANEPFDHRLGAIQDQLQLSLTALRAANIPPPGTAFRESLHS